MDHCIFYDYTALLPTYRVVLCRWLITVINVSLCICLSIRVNRGRGWGAALTTMQYVMYATSGFEGDVTFLADRTIGRAFGTLFRLSVCRRLSVCL